MYINVYHYYVYDANKINKLNIVQRNLMQRFSKITSNKLELCMYGIKIL